MGQILHGSVTTTDAVRRALQRSEESVRALARRYSITLEPITVVGFVQFERSNKARPYWRGD